MPRLSTILVMVRNRFIAPRTSGCATHLLVTHPNEELAPNPSPEWQAGANESKNGGRRNPDRTVYPNLDQNS